MYSLTKGHRIKYVAILLIILFATFLTLINSYLAKIVIDCFSKTNGIPDIYNSELLGPVGSIIVELFGGPDFIMDNKWILAIAVVGFGVSLAGANIAKGLLRAAVESDISAGIRLKLFEHIERLPFDFLKKQNNGDLLQTCIRDEHVLRNFLVRQFSGLCYTFDMVVLSFAILITIDWRIAVCAIAILPILFIYSFFLIRQVKKRYRATDDSEAVVTGKIEETINSIRVVKAYNNERHEIDSFEKNLNDYGAKYVRWRRLSAFFFASSDIFIFLEIVAATILSAVLCFYKEISLGTFVLAGTYTSMVVWPVRDCATTLSDLARATVSIDRMNLLLETPKEDIDSGLKPAIEGNIEFNNVSFKYTDSSIDCLKDINLSIKAKSTVAIMGKTGSGKTTLSLLLTRLYDYTSGSIKIDGIELKDIAKKHIRENIAMVLQEPFLFSRTIYQNLAIAKKDIGEEKIVKATKIADIHDTIKSFNEGYETEIGERGVTLSGGQKQRLAMARTILNDAPIMIFDDSLSAVDAETDNKIRSALKSRSKQSTTIIITHRINTAKDADLIIVLDDGKICEVGNHEQLINSNGFYANIYKLQTRIE